MAPVYVVTKTSNDDFVPIYRGSAHGYDDRTELGTALTLQPRCNVPHLCDNPQGQAVDIQVLGLLLSSPSQFQSTQKPVTRQPEAHKVVGLGVDYDIPPHPDLELGLKIDRVQLELTFQFFPKD